MGTKPQRDKWLLCKHQIDTRSLFSDANIIPLSKVRSFVPGVCYEIPTKKNQNPSSTTYNAYLLTIAAQKSAYW